MRKRFRNLPRLTKMLLIAPLAIIGMMLFAWIGGGGGGGSEASVELACAGVVRVAATHVLASTRPVGSLQDSVRRLWRWRRRQTSLKRRTTRWPGNAGANGGAVGADDA